MGQERAMICMSLLLLCVLICCETSFATTYMVGDASGWGINVTGWPKGKTFKAGDILEFTYNRANHDVEIVDKEAYDTCKIPEDVPAFQTGDDLITLKQGDNYFTSSFDQDCANGMKIAVTAT